MHALLLCVAAATGSLDAAAAALADFKVDEALRLLERAQGEGPYGYDDHVRLYEQLGVALAYAGRSEEAVAAFERLLALDPGHAISYSLSPKATLVFERARDRARQRPAPAVDLDWPRGAAVDQPLPIDLEVLADPERWFATARIHHRVEGAWQSVEIELGDITQRPRVLLPPPAPERRAPGVLQLWAVILDRRGNEVLQFGTSAAPREIPLAWAPPPEWYERWWVWAGAGALVAGGTAAILLSTRGEAPTIEGRAVVER